MAGAWAIARNGAPSQSDPPPWAATDGGVSPEVAHLRRRLNYLFGREGGTIGAVATLLVGMTLNVATLAVALWLIVRPLGWLVGSWVLTGASASHDPVTYHFGQQYWAPPAVWAGISVVAFLGWVIQRRLASIDYKPLNRFTGRTSRTVLRSLALGAMPITLTLAVLLIGLPAAAAALPHLVRDHRIFVRVAQALAGGGIVATVVKIARRPLGRMLPRLGGALVVLVGVVVASEIVAGGARVGLHEGRGPWVNVLAGFAFWYLVADPDWWSLQPYYRGRLRDAYATQRASQPDGTTQVVSLEPKEEPALSKLGRRPELLVCATMNVTRRDPTRVGVPAYSFTFSPQTIRFHVPRDADGLCDDYEAETAKYAGLFRRWDTPRLTPMTAVGMSGAAVSSAMGRHNYGSTNALLAVANIRLGMWMPNPRCVPEGELPDKPGFPRRRVGYLFKEIFGLYDPDDIYVYVTDGGHWENLGVVELIRRRCAEIVCVDASGAESTSFATISEAITLAAQECGAAIELPFEELRTKIKEGKPERTAPRNCGMGLITYDDNRTGVLWYVRSSLTANAPSRLNAYKEKNPIFPCDPTTNQVFDTEKFECYRLLGSHTAEDLLRLRAEVLAVLKRASTACALLSEAERQLIRRFDDPLRAALVATSPARARPVQAAGTRATAVTGADSMNTVGGRQRASQGFSSSPPASPQRRSGSQGGGRRNR